MSQEGVPSNSSESEPVASAPSPPAGGAPRVWRRGLLMQIGFLPLATTILLGMGGGIGLFTFGYGEGASYMTNNPESCINCHVMQDHYDSWIQSSHRHVAVCNDCHLPPDALGKWITKADNGFFHSLAFTTGVFHEPIQIKPRNRRVTQSACISCHGDLVDHMLPAVRGGDMLSCVQCHSDVGHRHRP